MIVSKKRITDRRKRNKNTGSMRANQESWFRSDQREREREREREGLFVWSGFRKKKKKKTERVIAIWLRSTPRVATIRIVLELRRRPGQGLGWRLALASDLRQLVFHCRWCRRCVLYTNGKETPSLLSIYSGKILWFLAGAEWKGLWWRFWRIGRLDLASAVREMQSEEGFALREWHWWVRHLSIQILLTLSL